MTTGRRERLRESTAMRPLREIEGMRRRFEDDVARPFLRNVWDRISYELKGYSPPMDVFEKGDDMVVKVELPGIRYEDIDVSVSENALVIRGEKKKESNVEDKDYYQSEIACGSFCHSLALSSDIDTSRTEAIYEDGVLRITLKRALGAKPQKIEVRAKKEEV